MTPDTNPQPPVDDETVARLVREVADVWVMPAVRLDQPAWRDRVRSRRARRFASARGVAGRLGQAATAAVALTVGAALFAVWLTVPRSPAGVSPAPSGRQTPGPTQGAAASPMPKLLVVGDPPTPDSVAVQVDFGGIAIADLASGSVGPTLTSGTSWGSQVERAPDGTLVCLCLATDRSVRQSDTHAVVSLRRFDAAGHSLSSAVIVDVTGVPDPRDGAIPEMPGHVSAWTTFSVDGRYAYVGWSARAHPVWRTGLVVVDLGDGSVIQRIALPDRSTGVGESRTFADAPRLFASVATGRVVIVQPWYSWTPVASSNPSHHFDADVLVAAATAGVLSQPRAVPAGTGCGDAVSHAGALPSGETWLTCARSGQDTIVRRLGADGSLLGDRSVAATYVDGTTALVSPDGASLFIWDPTGLVLTKVDLVTGAVSTGQAPKPTAFSQPDPLAALGRWLAPAALAKVILQSGIAISADGSRIFTLGIDGNPASPEMAGSAGVFVFDATSL
ncbi:MAG TPA: hypothetical protein VGQ85_05725, partial [Candidatus Limnocylindrales bacterium]|nr:hypothetical protein [Candidatus Limnocylindrales bacterium]